MLPVQRGGRNTYQFWKHQFQCKLQTHFRQHCGSPQETNSGKCVKAHKDLLAASQSVLSRGMHVFFFEREQPIRGMQLKKHGVRVARAFTRYPAVAPWCPVVLYIAVLLEAGGGGQLQGALGRLPHVARLPPVPRRNRNRREGKVDLPSLSYYLIHTRR